MAKRNNKFSNFSFQILKLTQVQPTIISLLIGNVQIISELVRVILAIVIFYVGYKEALKLSIQNCET